MKAIPLLLLAVLLSATAAAQNSLIGQGSSLSAELLRYEPNPAEPGDVVNVHLVLINKGGNTARNVQVEFLDNYPFFINDPASRVKSLAAIPGQESSLVRFNVRVDKDAPEGTSFLKVRYTVEGASAAQESLLALDIRTLDAAIAIEDIAIEPSPVTPGSQATITLSMKNIADSRLRNIAVALGTTQTVGTTTSQIPIAPLGGSLERRAPELAGGQLFRVAYSIIVKPDAASDVYHLPITVTFDDESGNNFTKFDQVGLVVSAKAKLDAYIDSVEVFTDQPVGTLTLRFVNSGLSKIKLLTAHLGEDASFDLRSTSSSVYIGNIDSDDYETATVAVKAHGDRIRLPLRLEYLDALNAPYDDEAVLEVPLLTLDDAGLKERNTAGLVIGLIAVAIVAWIVVRRIRRHQRRKALAKHD